MCYFVYTRNLILGIFRTWPFHQRLLSSTWTIMSIKFVLALKPVDETYSNKSYFKQWYFHVLLFITCMLCKMVVTLKSIMSETPLCVTIQMKAVKQYILVVPFIMLYKVVLTFKSVDETLLCDHSMKSYWAVLSCGTVYLRNSKNVPCFYRVIETRVEVWENEKCCGNTSHRRVFPQLFQVLPNFHKCFNINSIETRRTCFRFLLEKIATKKGKQLVNFDYQNVNSLCSRRHYVNSSC